MDHEAVRRDRFLLADDDRLLADCEVHCYRASGPGGQKRNKTSSAVRLRHRPTGLAALAAESRSQHRNRAGAVRRLRMAIALRVRAVGDLASWQPPGELAAVGGAAEWLLLPGKDGRYPLVVASVLDVLAAGRGRVSVAAARLGVSTAGLVAFLRHDGKVWAEANRIRREAGHRPLR
jgi:hypothetical protein